MDKISTLYRQNNGSQCVTDYRLPHSLYLIAVFQRHADTIPVYGISLHISRVLSDRKEVGKSILNIVNFTMDIFRCGNFDIMLCICGVYQEIAVISSTGCQND